MGIENAIQSKTEEIQDLDIKKRQQFIIDIIVGQFERAQMYTNTIIAGSYAAFFTSWAGIQSDLPQFERVFSLMLMLVSLLVFLGWEIFKMIKRAFLVREQIGVAKSLPQDFEMLLPEIVKKETNYNLLNETVWPGVLILTIVPAIFSAVIFFAGCFKVLFFNSPGF